MENKTKTRIFAGVCTVLVIAAAAVSVMFYGTKNAAARVLPDKQAAIEEELRAGRADEQPAEHVFAPEETAATEEETPVITADMPMELLTESGLHPAQEAALLISEYDRTVLPEEAPVYEEPVSQPSPATGYVAPAEPAPDPQPAPAPQPVITDNQQEGCVGDGLTY